MVVVEGLLVVVEGLMVVVERLVIVALQIGGQMKQVCIGMQWVDVEERTKEEHLAEDHRVEVHGIEVRLSNFSFWPQAYTPNLLNYVYMCDIVQVLFTFESFSDGYTVTCIKIFAQFTDRGLTNMPKSKIDLSLVCFLFGPFD